MPAPTAQHGSMATGPAANVPKPPNGRERRKLEREAAAAAAQRMGGAAQPATSTSPTEATASGANSSAGGLASVRSGSPDVFKLMECATALTTGTFMCAGLMFTAVEVLLPVRSNKPDHTSNSKFGSGLVAFLNVPLQQNDRSVFAPQAGDSASRDQSVPAPMAQDSSTAEGTPADVPLSKTQGKKLRRKAAAAAAAQSTGGAAQAILSTSPLEASANGSINNAGSPDSALPRAAPTGAVVRCAPTQLQLFY